MNLLDRIGDWNPQLLREIKGRLKFRNIAIAAVTSLVGQLLLFLFWAGQQPSYSSYGGTGTYCRLRDTFLAYQKQYNQLQDKYHQLQSQFTRYSGKANFNAEKVQQLKGSIAEVKGQIQQVQALQKDNLCPANAIDFPLWWHDHYPKIFASLSIF